jgi:prolyl-tRNA editing enzyme YbaK/EbsC (Cys-tRNA(Pro) deacylase)
VLIDDRAIAHESIHISAGRRGMDLELRVDDLVRMTGARSVHLGAPEG